MTEKQLIRATELRTLISITSKGLKNLKDLREKALKKPAVKGGDGKADALYNFYISEYSSETNEAASLGRYEGNDELLEVIISTLDRQLKDFQKEFDAL